MIKLDHVEKVYDTPAGPLRGLWPINLDVKAGEIFGVIGKSGAGKSTLIRCINLLERPSNGTVTVAGVELTQLNEKALRQARHRIGMIFQHFNLLSSKTVYDNVALPLKLSGLARSVIKDTVQPLLELTGLTDKADVYPAQLSGGQKQRVAIARALANKPDVLLCDEATSALDLHTTQNILALLLDINQKLGLTIVLITHEMEVIKSVTSQVALLDQGRIIEQNNTVEFFKHPQTEQAKELVKSCLKHELPTTLQQRLHINPGSGLSPVVRILFSNATTAEPLISELIHEQDIHINILQANIEYIRGEALGIMVIKIEQPPDGLHKTLDFLKNKQIDAEVIGYVE